MMSGRSTWLLVGVLLIAFALAIGVPDLHVFLFRQATLKEQLTNVFAAAGGVSGITCALLAPFSLLRDFSKLRRSR
jgi:hypothetical protein